MTNAVHKRQVEHICACGYCFDESRKTCTRRKREKRIRRDGKREINQQLSDMAA